MAPKKKRKGKGKGKAKDKLKIKAKDEERGKRKARDKGKAKDKDSAEIKTATKGKEKDKAKGKLKAEGKGKRKDRKEAKGKAKTKEAKKTKGQKKGKAKDQGKVEGKPQRKKVEAPTTQSKATSEPAADIASEKRYWERVATRLGLEKHVRAISRWDGRGDPPVLTGFSFVRHVESAARDLRCAGTLVTMTQGIVVQREDGKRFLVGRGVAHKYLGIAVPRKDPGNAGQRFLSLREREELGQALS